MNRMVGAHGTLGGEMMLPLHVIAASHSHAYSIHVKFSDGSEGIVDLGAELDGEVFGPLKDLAQFKAFKVDPELETIVWDNGADFAPEFLRSLVHVSA